MVRIRLRRVGAKKQPSYRIVVADQRSPRDGRFIESIGYYNPRTEPETVHYDEDRALHWLSVGAQPSDAVHRLLNNGGTYGRLERLHQGESIETLVEEALAEAEKRTPVSPKTRHEPRKKAKAVAEKVGTEEAVAEVEVAVAEVEEAETAVDADEAVAEAEVAEAEAEEVETAVDADEAVAEAEAEEAETADAAEAEPAAEEADETENEDPE
jgi:small subunit ribosomal protein S16